MKNSITVKSFSVIERTKIESQSKLQKFICKWFDISPVETYSFVLDLFYYKDKDRYGRPIDIDVSSGDVLLSGDGKLWKVLEVVNDLVKGQYIVVKGEGISIGCYGEMFFIHKHQGEL